ncbi:MAG TPA: efflux RND transporter periplasmic adaptor subunit [Edaphobacter sp.]|nr:efflux RND transporter periplasmic adaptor subunit [Edaphobacter sp.]
MRRLQSICLFVLCLVPFAGCNKNSETETPAPVVVQVEKPETGEIAEQIVADAVLSPLAQAAIAPRITAPVKVFYVQRGTHVKKGELLALLEDRDLAAQALDNKGQYEAAQAAFEMQTKAQVPEDYRKAQLDLAQATAQLNLQKSIVASRKELLKEGAIAGRDYDTAAAALVQAQSAYDVAANHVASLEKISRQAQLQQAQGQLSSAKGKYLGAEALASYAEIRSPISGIVTDRPLFAGETAAAGAALVTVMDTSALIAKIHLSQSMAQRLKVGDPASVSIPGADAATPAKVSLISPALDPGSLTVEVWARIENVASRYKAGTPVKVSIRGRVVENAIKIPQSAVFNAQDGSKFVMLVGADGLAHKTTVTTGITDGSNVQITSGLNPQQTVITTGAYGLDDGAAVKIGAADGDEK